MAKVIGIDFRISSTLVWPFPKTVKPKWLIENARRRTHHAVRYRLFGQRRNLVGAPAKRQAVTNAKNTIYAAKRLIGHKFEDKEVQRDIESMPFEIIKANNGDAWVKAQGKELSPPQISAEVPKSVKWKKPPKLTWAKK